MGVNSSEKLSLEATGPIQVNRGFWNSCGADETIVKRCSFGSACVLHPGAFLPTKGGVIADTNMGDHLGATLGSQSTTRKGGVWGGT